ncbi:hypothetical protein ACH4SP_28275 [Streptomyces sp. NPDC021093]|uniref:hypothetical protein n=1 Tax=Streptomyces sp. NPDC021093 TaxID=3365112 RepID=UPI0037B946EF
MSQALETWARVHARSVGRGVPTAPGAVGRGVAADRLVGSLGEVRDVTPAGLRAYTRLCLAAPEGGPVVGAASAVAPVGNAAGPRTAMFELVPDEGGGLRTEEFHAPFVPVPEWPVGWAYPGDGSAVLAMCGGGSGVTLRTAGAGYGGRERGPGYSAVARDPGFPLVSAKFTTGPGGALLLTAGSPGRILVWDLADSAPCTYYVPDTTAVEWGEVQQDGTGLVATGHLDGRVRVWEFDGSFHPPLHVMPTADGPVRAVAWGMLPDGSALLASGHDRGTIKVWDGLTGTRLAAGPPCSGSIDSVVWAARPNGRCVLASGHSDGTVRVWSGDSLRLLREFDDLTASGTGPFDAGCVVNWLQLPEGELWLYAASETGARIWEVDLKGLEAAPWATGTTKTTGTPKTVVAAETIEAVRSAAGPGRGAHPWDRPVSEPLRRGLVSLAAGGACPSLGLLADLVALIGPAASADLLDERLSALAGHPGVKILRDLEWPAPSRVGLAGLLLAGLPEQDTVPLPPHTSHTPRELSDVLRRALIGRSSRPPDRVPPLAALRTAADTVTGRTTALLAVIGPEAVAADPMLPLRTAQQAVGMPAVDLRRLQLLTGSASSVARHAGTTVHAPGSGGISHRGRITQMLPSQLVLPVTLLNLRYARQELLYRLHGSSAQWEPEPVALVLDTSPPTFGPAEVVLRSLAHLLATTLWCHGRHAVFVGLDRPDLMRPVARPADLAMLWTSRTLEPPDLAGALNTAASTGMPTVLLALHHLVRDQALVAGPRLRLATTHQGDDLPRARPPENHHVHLPPAAAGARLADAVRLLLAGGGPS